MTVFTDAITHPHLASQHPPSPRARLPRQLGNGGCLWVKPVPFSPGCSSRSPCEPHPGGAPPEDFPTSTSCRLGFCPWQSHSDPKVLSENAFSWLSLKNPLQKAEEGMESQRKVAQNTRKAPTGWEEDAAPPDRAAGWTPRGMATTVIVFSSDDKHGPPLLTCYYIVLCKSSKRDASE